MRPPHWALRAAAAYYDARTRRAIANPRATQAGLLRSLLAEYRDTELGRSLGLGAVAGPDDFKTRVPVTDETHYQPFCQRALEENPPDWLTRGHLTYMARSSGTTSVRKLVAFTWPLIKAYKRYETRVAMHTMRELDRFDMLDARLLITAGSPAVETTAAGVTIGYGTGIMTKLAPAIAQDLVRPTRDILSMTDWEAKLEATVRQALPLDIRAMTGVPLFATQIAERLLAVAAEEGLPARTLQALWPKLAVYYWSGSPITMYESRLRALFGPDVPFRELYTCTESPLGYQYRLGQPGVLLNLEDTYFEFQPADSAPDSPRLGLHEVSLGVPYRVLISTWGGLFAYRLGDLVEFLSLDPPLIRVGVREKDEISLGYEHIQLDVVRAALDEASAKAGARVRNFFLGPANTAPGDRQAYHWYVEYDEPPQDPEAFRRALDQGLIDRHPFYAGMRTDDAVLLPPRLTELPRGTIDRHVLETRQFGQGKFLHLYSQRAAVESILNGAPR
ncbi:GH3 auxin-responsive promoter [compost metagenome]